MKHEMTFSEARDRVKTLVICSFISCVLDLILSTLGPSAQIASLILMVATLGFMIAVVYTVFRYCRCPKCRKVIYFGVFKASVCPRCRRNLITGKKGK